jgi:uncharacterized protein (DUF433 family)
MPSMVTLPLTQSTPLVQDEDGAVRIAGSRVTLDSLAHAFDEGATAEQIQDSFPSLTLRDIYGAIAYYLEHRSEVGEYLKARQQEAVSVRRTIEDRQDPAIRARIRARRDQLARP